MCGSSRQAVTISVPGTFPGIREQGGALEEVRDYFGYLRASFPQEVFERGGLRKLEFLRELYSEQRGVGEDVG